MNANAQRPGAPAVCTCTEKGGRIAVATLAETLHCPMVWQVTRNGCFHVLPARRKAAAR